MSKDELRSAAASEVDRWERLLTDELLRLFDRQQAVVLARLQGTKARKHTRHWEPAGDRVLEVKQIIDPARWLMDAAGSVAPIVRRLFGAVYKRVAEGLGAGEPGDEQRTEDAIQQRLDLVAKGVESAVQEVATFVEAGEASGMSMPDLVKGVRELYEQRAATWAQRIATISAVGSINQAAWFAAWDAGSSAKQWLSRRDDKVRDTHVHADGQVRLLDEPFRLGGIPTHPRKSLLMFPGDPSPQVPLDEIMNCRCTLLFSPPKPATKSDDDGMERKDRVRTPGGVQQYGLPIGSIIPPASHHLAPAFSSTSAAVVPPPRSTPVASMSDAELHAAALYERNFQQTRGMPAATLAVSVARQQEVLAEMNRRGGAPARPARPPRATRIGDVGGQHVELGGSDPKVRALVAQYAPAAPDPATTEVAVLRDRKGRVAAYVVWQTEDGPQPKGTILQVSVHPSLRGKRIGDQLVQVVAGHDNSVKPTTRPSSTAGHGAPASRTLASSPGLTRATPVGPPQIRDRTKPGDTPGTSGDYDADAARIDRLQKAYLRDRVDTESLFSRGGRWSRTREKQQQEIIDHFLSKPGVKPGQKILVLGGLPGAGKTTTINSAAGQAALGINIDEYVTVNADEVKAEMVKRGMVPDYPGLSADEAATLYHAESFEIAHSLMRQAAKRKLNFAYDTSLKSPGQLGFATGAGSRTAPPPWETTVLFVDVPLAVAKQRARQRYLDGERYMPLGLIDGMASSSRRHNSAPARNFDGIKGQVDRWVLVDNAGADPVVVDQGGKSRTPRAPRATRPPAAPVAAAVAPRPAQVSAPVTPPPAAPSTAPLSGRVAESRMTEASSEADLSVGQRVWARSSGYDNEWELSPGTVTSVDVYYDDPDVSRSDPKKIGIRLDSGGSDETEYWHVVTRVDGDPPAPAQVAPPKPPAAPAAPAPAVVPAASSGLPPALPPVPAGAKVYVHPQGKTIYLLPDGTMQVWKPDGKKATSSATAAKLLAGYGGWAEVVGGQAPQFGPVPTKAPSARTGTDPAIVSAPAAPLQVSASTPAPAGALPVVPMDFNEADLADVPKYIADPNYVFQQKVDGIRGVLVIDGGKAPWFASKKGDQLQSTTAAKITGPMLGKLPATPAGSPSYRVEGELLNGKFHVFDMYVVGQESEPYEKRKAMADAWVDAVAPSLPQVEKLPTAVTAAEKQALWDKVVANGAEGVMMKRRDSPYDGGARVSHTLKAKITATADVVVIEKNIGGKDNARIALLHNGKVTPIGTISTLGKGPIDLGDVLEVEYLWATPSNTLAQPRIIRKRPDKTVVDVTDSSQLRQVNKTVHALAQKRLALQLERLQARLEVQDGSGS